jgi:hypothetical protein
MPAHLVRPRIREGFVFMTKRSGLVSVWILIVFNLNVGAASILYASGFAQNNLLTIDTFTALPTHVGYYNTIQADCFCMYGLAYDATRDVLYGATPYEAFTINRQSGQATPIGPFGTTDMYAIAYDDLTSTLYGIRSANSGAVGDGLFRIDTTTGAATRIGELGLSDPENRTAVVGLTSNPRDGYLYGVAWRSTGDIRLVQINPLNGQSILMAQLQPRIRGIAFQPESGILFGVSEPVDASLAQLFTIDPSSGAETPVGTVNFLDHIAGLQFVAPIPEPASYLLLLSGFVLTIMLKARGAFSRDS